MSVMSDEEFERIYGRPPRRVVKVKKVYWNRVIAAAVIIILIIVGLVKAISAIASSGGDSGSNAPVVVNKSNKTTSSADKTSSKEEKTDDKSNGKLDFTVCIDAGHGDFDGGTTNADGTRLEKDDNLAISLIVQKYLEEANVNVVMTRDDDTFIELDDRSTIANESKSDLFVCLHRNSYNEDMSGVEIWVSNDEPEPDTTLAENIMSALEDVGITKNRGVQYGYIGNPSVNYAVNSQSVMPSCLVELGFVTDETDNEYFDKYKDEYGKAIADAIIQTAKELGIIDDNGKRLISGQYISTEKYINRSGSDSEAVSNDVTETNPSQTTGTIYNTQETEY